MKILKDKDKFEKKNILFFEGINNIKQTKNYKEIIFFQDKERDIILIIHTDIGKKKSKSSLTFFYCL